VCAKGRTGLSVGVGTSLVGGGVGRRRKVVVVNEIMETFFEAADLVVFFIRGCSEKCKFLSHSIDRCLSLYKKKNIFSLNYDCYLLFLSVPLDAPTAIDAELILSP